MNKVYIWGTGEQAKNLCRQNAFKECEILGFIDTYKSKEEFMGYPVIKPDEMQDEYDYIIISVKSPAGILEQCKELRVESSKIIVVFNYMWESLQYVNHDDELIRQRFPSLARMISDIKANAVPPIDTIYTCYYDGKDKERLIGTDLYNGEYYKEYIRYRTFELAAKELEKLPNQNWDVAELGVFRGAFSRLINRKFSDKTLYLFDTFEGFNSDEAGREQEAGHCDSEFIEYFADNNVDMVISIMPFKDKCIVRKGYFPETSKGLEDVVYGFVSLDVDFGDSTFAGLEYFYPRLVEGGYIFVHDYNHPSLRGVKEAVARYEKEHCIMLKKIPIPDSNGTLVITK